MWMYFPEFGPKRLSFGLLNTWFELGRQIWKFQILLLRSSEGFLARASTFIQGSARASIERGIARGMQKIQLEGIFQKLLKIGASLERASLRSSELMNSENTGCSIFTRDTTLDARSSELAKPKGSLERGILRSSEEAKSGISRFVSQVRTKHSTTQNSTSWAQILEKHFKLIVQQVLKANL